MERAYNRPAGCLSDLTIDRLIVDELDGPTRAATLVHADTCTWCSARIAELRAEHQRFADQPLPIFLGRSRRVWLGASAGLAAAAALALVVMTSPAEPEPEPELAPASTTDVVRSKGSGQPGLGLRLERDGRLETLLPGESIVPGARVQPTYTAAEGGWLAVFGVDGAGRVQRHYPDDAQASTGAFHPPGRDEPLPFSLTFDATPGPERVIAVHCPHAIDIAAVERRLADGAAPAPGSACTVDRIELPKAGP
jgi:hypothetical protein